MYTSTGTYENWNLWTIFYNKKYIYKPFFYQPSYYNTFQEYNKHKKSLQLNNNKKEQQLKLQSAVNYKTNSLKIIH